MQAVWVYNTNIIKILVTLLLTYKLQINKLNMQF